MILVVLILEAVIACSGGLIIGIALGTLAERERAARRRPLERAARRRPLEPHEALARLDQMLTERAILGELRGPLPTGRERA